MPVRLLQLWARLFVASVCVQLAALIAVAAGATPWVRTASAWAVASLAAVGALLVIAIILRRAALKRRLLRAVSTRHDSVIVAPYDVVEQAFGPLVESRAVHDLAVAVVLPGHDIVYFPAANPHAHSTTLYEVGSLTKPMTAEVLASMIADGTAAMTTRIGNIVSHPSLPDRIASITIGELATHQSGLPRIPRTFRLVLAALLSADPYRWFDAPALLRSLTSARRTAPPGTYSNFGFALLAYAIGELQHSDFRSVLEARLLRPLGLHSTYLDPDEGIALRHARGHDFLGVPASRWHAGAIAGASGVSMTLPDGAKWLSAHVDPPAAFRDIVAMVTRPLAPFGTDRVGMGWIVTAMDGRSVAWHNGGTGGFSSFAAFDAAVGVGVIAFAASSHISALDRAGFHVIRECATRWGRRDEATTRTG